MLPLSIQNRSGFTVKMMELTFLHSHLPRPGGILVMFTCHLFFYEICKMKIFELRWIKTIVFFPLWSPSVTFLLCRTLLRGLRHSWDLVKGKMSWRCIWPMLRGIYLCSLRSLVCRFCFYWLSYSQDGVQEYSYPTGLTRQVSWHKIQGLR